MIQHFSSLLQGLVSLAEKSLLEESGKCKVVYDYKVLEIFVESHK